MGSSIAVLQKKIMASALKLVCGILFSMTGIFSGQCFAAAMDDEKYGLSVKMGKVLGGVVVSIQKMASRDQTKFLLDLVPLGLSGQPICQKPEGQLAEVLMSRIFRRQTNPGVFTIFDDRRGFIPPAIKVGDCLTVEGRKVKYLFRETRVVEDRIRIVSTLKGSKIRLIQAFFIKLWPGKIYQKSRIPNHSSGLVSLRR